MYAMSIETLENLIEKAGSLSPAERLLLASRLIESVRQRDLSDSFQKGQREALKNHLINWLKCECLQILKTLLRGKDKSVKTDHCLGRLHDSRRQQHYHLCHIGVVS